MSRLEIIKKKLPEATALLLTSEINQRWLTGFDYTDGFALVTPAQSYLITDFRYVEAAQNEANEGFTVVVPEQGMLAFIAEALKKSGCTRVMIEEVTLPVSSFERYKTELRGVELIGGASSLCDGQRRFKDSDEIERIKAAQAITDAAFDHILGYITPERTEVDVALELEFFMRKQGAESVAFQTIAVSGSASSMPHGVPRPVKLERGFLTMDFGAKYRGYCSDMTRTVVLGRADEEEKRLYNTVLEAQTAALAAFEAGERGRLKLDTIARDIIDNAGYRGCFGHSLGHGVGMYIHEAPGMSQKVPSGAMLQVGDVVTFEPGIYISGKYGCRIEDMATVTETGTYNFTRSPKNLIEI